MRTCKLKKSSVFTVIFKEYKFSVIYKKKSTEEIYNFNSYFNWIHGSVKNL